jgi:hypothetical protein
MKALSQVDSQTIASLIDYQLTAEQIDLMLNGEESLLTQENLDLLETGILKICMFPIKRLQAKLMAIHRDRYLDNNNNSLNS